MSGFGVTVTFQGTGSSTQKGDSITYTDTSMLLHPGDEKVITAKISGRPSVNSTISVDVDITFDGNYTVLAKDFTAVNSNTAYFPIGFKVGGSTNYDVNPYTTGGASAIESEIEEAIDAKLSTLNLAEPTSGDGLTASWGPDGANLTETDISIKFDWPKGYNKTENDYYDEIGTYIAKNEPKFTITYTIKVEQAS